MTQMALALLTVVRSPSLPLHKNAPFNTNHNNKKKTTTALHIENNNSRQKTLPLTLRCATTGPNSDSKRVVVKKTCKNCKTQFDPSLNGPRACRFHTAHFGGETKRKFESVHTGGTMNTPDSGRISQYWHCCGSEDPFDPGCTAAPHVSYDD